MPSRYLWPSHVVHTSLQCGRLEINEEPRELQILYWMPGAAVHVYAISSIICSCPIVTLSPEGLVYFGAHFGHHAHFVYIHALQNLSNWQFYCFWLFSFRGILTMLQDAREILGPAHHVLSSSFFSDTKAPCREKLCTCSRCQ